jgi:hypothetical protein
LVVEVVVFFVVPGFDVVMALLEELVLEVELEVLVDFFVELEDDVVLFAVLDEPSPVHFSPASLAASLLFLTT